MRSCDFRYYRSGRREQRGARHRASPAYCLCVNRHDFAKIEQQLSAYMAFLFLPRPSESPR